MSVPFAPPSATDFLAALEKRGIDNFYIQYFQQPGVAEAELERDVSGTLRRIYFSASGDAPEGSTFGLVPRGQGFLANTVDPAVPPAWLGSDDLAYYSGAFARAGFRGGLNWYRNMRRSTALLAAWRGCIIRQPAMFIAGARDGVLRFPASRSPTVGPGRALLHGVAGRAARYSNARPGPSVGCQPNTWCSARDSARASVRATKAMPASAPLRCASWFTRPRARRAARIV